MWLAADGSQVARLPHPVSVERVSFSPSGAQLLTVARDARVYDARDWGRPPLLLDQPGNIVTAAFSPAGELVATGGRDNLAMIWDSRDGSRRHQLAHRGTVLDVAWSPNGSLLATGSTDNGGRVFRTDTGALVTFLGAHSNQVVSVGFSPDGASVVTASLDGSARVWGGDGFSQSEALHGHSGEVLDAMFTPDGRNVVTRSEDGSARVWRPAVDPILALVGRHTAAGRAVAVAPDGRIASVALDGTLRVWRRDGRSSPRHPAAGPGRGCRVLPGRVAPRHRRRRRRRPRLGSGRRQAAPVVHARRAAHVGGLRPRRDARRHRRQRRDGASVRASGRRTPGAPARHRRRHRRHVQPGRPLRRDGRRQRRGAGLADGIRAARRQAGRPAQGRFDGNRLQPKRQADRDGEPRRGCASLERVRPARWRRALRGHSAVVSDVVFSPDGRWVATAGPTTVGMWKTETGRRINKGTPVLFLRGHGPRVRSVAFFPDSRRVASIGDDGTVRTYLCELCGTAPQLAVRARRLLDRLGSNLTPAERTRYIGG